jgi:hypothetical protein
VNSASPGCLRQIVSLRPARPGRLAAILLHGKGPSFTAAAIPRCFW